MSDTMRLIKWALRAAIVLVLLALVACDSPPQNTGGRYPNAIVTTVYKSPIEGGSDVVKIEYPKEKP